MDTSKHDFVIVGSGPAGACIAWHLVEAGARVLLLEAGPAFDRTTFPDNEADASCQLYWNGGIDLSADGTMGFLRARCLGGTSVVNQCLLDRFDDLAFNDWRSVSGVDFFRKELFEPYYEAIEAKLSVREFSSKDLNRNAELFTRACDRLGYGWKFLRRGESDCHSAEGTDCIQCLAGCRLDSKQSALVTYLRWAREKGLQIRTRCEVERLEFRPDWRGQLAGGITLYAHENGKPVELAARRVVLAAGALGTTHILLRSALAERLPALGHGFFCHPQLMTFGLFDEPVDAWRGAFQTVKSYDARFRQAGFKLENVFAPPISVAMLLPGFGRRHQEAMRRYRHYASIEVAVRDSNPGRISLDGRGRLRIHKTFSPEDVRRATAGLEVVRKLLQNAGARRIFTSPMRFGLHLMGGCAIGRDPRKSVVNERFQAHGLPNVFIADSSIFPSAPGINPSLTIMALAKKAAEEMSKG